MSDSAVLITIYLVLVGISDNVLRPLLMGRGMSTPVLVIFIGVLGGTLAYGIVGLFVGPIVLSVAWELMMAWVSEEETAQRSGASSSQSGIAEEGTHALRCLGIDRTGDERLVSGLEFCQRKVLCLALAGKCLRRAADPVAGHISARDIRHVPGHLPNAAYERRPHGRHCHRVDAAQRPRPLIQINGVQGQDASNASELPLAVPRAGVPGE